MTKFRAREHGFERFLPPEMAPAPVSPGPLPSEHPSGLKVVEARPPAPVDEPVPPVAAPVVPRTTATASTAPTSTAAPVTAQDSRLALPPASSVRRRVLTIYITPAEDEILDQERQRRLALGGRRRGNTENSSLIREAIHTAFGDGRR